MDGVTVVEGVVVVGVVDEGVVLTGDVLVLVELALAG